VPGPLSIERLAQAVLTVCARLRITQGASRAHSMGTIVSQRLAVDQPKLSAASRCSARWSHRPMRPA
jgi:hypothetical protein